MALSKNTKVFIKNALTSDKPANELIDAVDSATEKMLIKDENYSAMAGDWIFADSTAAAFTIFLPAKPKFGMKVKISDFNDTWATNNVTVGRSGAKIQGVSSDFTLNVNGETVQFVYVGRNRGWNVIL